MRRALCAVLAAAFVITLVTGCTVVWDVSPSPDRDDPKADMPAATPSAPPSEAFISRFPSPGMKPLSLTDLSWSDELETAVGRLKVVVSFPRTGENEEINAYYQSRLEDLQTWADAFSEWAEGEHTLESVYQVECNQDGLLSVSHRQSIDGAVTIFTETFAAGTGERLNMEDLFAAGRESCTETLTAEVLSQLQSGSFSDLNEDYEMLARECFPYDTFCITPSGLSLIYPPQTLRGEAVRADIPFAVFADLWS